MTCYQLQVRENATKRSLNKGEEKVFFHMMRSSVLAQIHGRLPQQLIIWLRTQVLFSLSTPVSTPTFPFGLAPLMVGTIPQASHLHVSIQMTGDRNGEHLVLRCLLKRQGLPQRPSCTRIVSYAHSWTKYWQNGWTLIHSLNQESPPWAKELPGLPVKKMVTNYI